MKEGIFIGKQDDAAYGHDEQMRGEHLVFLQHDIFAMGHGGSILIVSMERLKPHCSRRYLFMGIFRGAGMMDLFEVG